MLEPTVRMIALSLIAVVGAGGCASANDFRSPACEAATALVGGAIADVELGALTDGPAPPFKGAWKRAGELRGAGWSGQQPTEELLDTWQASAGTNVLSCPDIQEAARRSAGSAQAGREAHLVGLPVLDHTGYEAIAQVSISKPSPALGGAVHLFLLQKRKSGWVVVSRRMLVIS